MKAKEITMQIVKNLGNYETVRFEVTYSLNDTNVSKAFEEAHSELENAYTKIYKTKQEVPKETREELTLTHPKFKGVCKALFEGDADLKRVEKHFLLTKEVMEYFKKHKLI